jgi:hypothetical protein
MTVLTCNVPQGLLESDTQRIIMGNRDWAQYIAEDLGYYVDFVSVELQTRLIKNVAHRQKG